MFAQQFMDQLTRQITDLLKTNPLNDLEHNLKAILQAGFTKLDLVTREEFAIQQKVLANTRAKLDELEQKISALESKDHQLGDA